MIWPVLVCQPLHKLQKNDVCRASFKLDSKLRRIVSGTPRRLTIIASNFKKAFSDCLQSSTSLGLLATGGPGESDSALPQHRSEGKQRSGGVAGAARWRGGDFSVG